MQQKKLFIYIGAGLFVLLLFILLTSVTRSRTAIEIVSVIPNDITVTIDGKKAPSNGKVAIKAGAHQLVAKRDDFAAQTITVDVKKNETKTVRLFLKPTNSNGQRWLNNNEEEIRKEEGSTGKAYDEAAQKAVEKNQLIALLPMLRRDWRIDYGNSVRTPNDPEAVAIIITYATDASKENALKWIRQQGFDPADYEIIYKTVN